VDAEKAIVLMQTVASNNAGYEGATVAIEPASGEGPFYSGTSWMLELDPDATATSSTALAVFFNVDPGEYTLSASGAGEDTCVPRLAAPETPVLVEAKANVIAVGIFVCAP
jgi:hypothetical protein